MMFEELETTLKRILQEMQAQKELLRIVLSSLTTSKQVATFLNVSPRTIEGWVRKGILKEGVHFHRNGKRLEFIPDAIIEFKHHPEKRRVQESKQVPMKVEPVNPTTKRIVAGIKKVSNG
jgi:hypothetical protein